MKDNNFMWTKEECNSFFKKTLGLELIDEELINALTYLQARNLSPNSSHGDWNIGFTPLKLIELVNFALEKTKGKLQDTRFKKVSEEIFPTIYFTLLLAKLNYGKHLIVSSDVPDIALVPIEALGDRRGNTINAFPLECIFLPPEVINNTAGENDSQKIAKLIIEKKFIKRYVPQTTLLISLNKPIENLNITEISDLLLKNEAQPFHQVWIFCNLGSDDISLTQLCPSLLAYNLNIQTDLNPLLY
ncbi:MAG: hypothetical protein Q8P32_00875 [Candidatus Komeilibacteria bacterium]|nr:hypothetical protein [Candidatus Komeilibacteria bacterium]